MCSVFVFRKGYAGSLGEFGQPGRYSAQYFARHRRVETGQFVLGGMILLLLTGCADWTPIAVEDLSISETEEDTLPDSDVVADSERGDTSDACPEDPEKTEPGACGCGVADSELRNWYPDCDGDGGFDSTPVHACGAAEAEVAFDCADGSNPRGGWSDTPGDDCDDGDPSHPCPCDEQDNNKDGICEPLGSLKDVQNVGTGLMDFELRSGTHSLFIDDDQTSGGWVLIGRGREGWYWNEEGFGDQSKLTEGLGTPDAFAPVYLPGSVIQELMDNAGIDLTMGEIRVRRAADPEGKGFQETLWISQENPDWIWLFDSTDYGIEYHVVDSVLGEGTSVAATTRDVGYPPNDHRRTFTWAWDGHNYVQGFSYGSAVTGGTNDPTNFFWQHGSEGHALPYSEIYIRYRELMPSCRAILERYPSAADGAYRIDPDGVPQLVTCDMTGGGWMVIYQEDFSGGSSSGWQDGAGDPCPVDTTSSCAVFYGEMLGGYGNFGAGAQAVQTFDLSGFSHSEVAVELDYVVIDSWDSEDAIIRVDGVEYYRATMGGTAADMSNDCGSKWNERGPQHVSFQLSHTAPTVTVQVTSSLDSGPTDEAFGIDNVWIRVR